MIKSKRNWALFFLFAALLAAFVLAAGLSGLELKPGEPFILGAQDPSEAPENPLLETGGAGIVRYMGALVALALVLLPVYIIIRLLTPEGRRRLLVELALITAVTMLLYFVTQRAAIEEPLSPEGQGSGFDISELLQGEPTHEFSPSAPLWVEVLSLVSLAVLLSAFAVGVIWYVRRRKTPELTPLQRLAQEAQEAVDQIYLGGDFKDVILRCYAQMSRVLQEERGLRRDIAMTPREFERLLAERGVPHEPVRRLTRLFEEIRYGARQPGQREEQEAVLCLTSIVDYCRAGAAS